MARSEEKRTYFRFRRSRWGSCRSSAAIEGEEPRRDRGQLCLAMTTISATGRLALPSKSIDERGIAALSLQYWRPPPNTPRHRLRVRPFQGWWRHWRGGDGRQCDSAHLPRRPKTPGCFQVYCVTNFQDWPTSPLATYPALRDGPKGRGRVRNRPRADTRCAPQCGSSATETGHHGRKSCPNGNDVRDVVVWPQFLRADLWWQCAMSDLPRPSREPSETGGTRGIGGGPGGRVRRSRQKSKGQI